LIPWKITHVILTIAKVVTGQIYIKYLKILGIGINVENLIELPLFFLPSFPFFFDLKLASYRCCPMPTHYKFNSTFVFSTAGIISTLQQLYVKIHEKLWKKRVTTEYVYLYLMCTNGGTVERSYSKVFVGSVVYITQWPKIWV